MEAQPVVSWRRPCHLRKDGVFVTAAEPWRWWANVSWLVLFATGAIVTEVSGGLDGFPNKLPQSFQAPVNMILPLIYAITLVFWIAYFLVLYMRVGAEHKDGLLSNSLKTFLSCSYKFASFSIVCFSLIWVVSPETDRMDLTSPFFKTSLVLHRLPYLLLQIGLTTLAVSHSVYQLKTGYWRARSERIGRVAKYILPTYCVAMALNACINVALYSICLYNRPWSPPSWLVSIFQPFSLGIFFLGLFAPIIKESIALFCFPGQLNLVTVRFRI